MYHGSLRVGNETLRPLGAVPCFGRKLQTKKWMTYFPGAPLYCGRAGSDVIGCRRPTSGVFVCMLQTRVTLTTEGLFCLHFFGDMVDR